MGSSMFYIIEYTPYFTVLNDTGTERQLVKSSSFNRTVRLSLSPLLLFAHSVNLVAAAPEHFLNNQVL